MTPQAVPEKAVLALKTLKPASYNPRTISDEALDVLVEEMRQEGYLGGIVVNDRANAPGWSKAKPDEKVPTIVGGHQRVLALMRLDFEEAEVAVVRLNPRRERILNLALNQTGGTWDEPALEALVKDLAADGGVDDLLAIAGFPADRLDELLRIESVDADFQEVPTQIEATHTCPKCGYAWKRGAT